MGKRSLTTDAEVKAAVDSLLGAFGVLGDAEPEPDSGFGAAAPKTLTTGERRETAPSARVDALWGEPGRTK
jgi:hypothetical protein